MSRPPLPPRPEYKGPASPVVYHGGESERHVSGISAVPPPIPLSSKPGMAEQAYYGSQPASPPYTSPMSGSSYPSPTDGSSYTSLPEVVSSGYEESPPPLPPRSRSTLVAQQAKVANVYSHARNNARKELEEMQAAGRKRAQDLREKVRMQLGAVQQQRNAAGSGYDSYKKAVEDGYESYKVSRLRSRSSASQPTTVSSEVSPSYSVQELVQELDSHQIEPQLDGRRINMSELDPYPARSELDSQQIKMYDLPSIEQPQVAELPAFESEPSTSEKHQRSSINSSSPPTVQSPTVPVSPGPPSSSREYLAPHGVIATSPSQYCKPQYRAPAVEDAQTEQVATISPAIPMRDTSAKRSPVSPLQIEQPQPSPSPVTSSHITPPSGQVGRRGTLEPGNPSHLIPTGCYYTVSQPPSNIPSEQTKSYFVGRECPNDQLLKYSTFWFRHVNISNFFICSRCFESYIRNTQFESSFVGRMDVADSATAWCMFGVPRVTDVLWPRAIQVSDMRDVEGYMRARAALPHCHGVSGVSGQASHGLKWFQAKRDAIPGFVACETCYNAYVVGSSFELNFALHDQGQDPNMTWACDVAVPYLNRAIKTFSKRNDWAGFVAAANHRIRLPACEQAKKIKAKTRSWYEPREGRPNAAICETCYLDRLSLTAQEHEFAKVESMTAAEKDVEVACDTHIFSLNVALEAAVMFSNMDLFWNTCQTQLGKPLCTTTGITNGTWYTIKGRCENFNICPTCYAGMVASYGLQSLFELQPQAPPGTSKVCDFCPGTARFGDYMARYNLAINTPTTSVFVDYVQRMAPHPLCSRSKTVERQWYTVNFGGEHMFVCPSCYEDVVRDGPLTQLCQRQPTAATAMCELYSRNMRTRWAAAQEACGKANTRDPTSSQTPPLPNNATSIPTPTPQALQDFIEYRNLRIKTYNEITPEIRRLTRSMTLRLGQQRLLNMNSSFYTSLDRTSSAAMGIHYGPTPQYTTVYGSSGTSGYFATPWGVTGAQYGRQAAAVAGGGTGDMGRLAYLEALWEEYE